MKNYSQFVLRRPGFVFYNQQFHKGLDSAMNVFLRRRVAEMLTGSRVKKRI